MDHFEQIRELGAGGYGRALLVRRHADNCLLVIKQMRLPYLLSAISTTSQNAPGGTAWNEAKIVELAYQEVKLLTSIRHPNIVKAFEAFEDGSSNLNLVMEYCECGDLNQAILQQNGNLFAEQQIRNWFSQLIFATKYLHDRHILHRDIKAANIFLVSERRVIKLGDFGIAKMLDRTGGLAMTQIGTPTYIAPEICDGLPYGEKAEVWSLGIVLYQMASLILPFVEQNLPALFNAIKIKAHLPIPTQYSAELRNLLDRLLAKDATDRPSVNEIVTNEFLLSGIAELVIKGVGVSDAGEQVTPVQSSVSVTTPSSASSSGVNTISLRSDDFKEEDELHVRIRQSNLIEPIFKEPLIAILRDQLLTAKTLVTLSDEELKELCPNKKGLQLALAKLVQQLREEERKDACETLKIAIEQNDCDAIRKVAKSCDEKIGDVIVDVDARNTALHFACKLGQTDPLKLLLSLGADMTLRNRYEDQPLHVATFGGRLLAVDILLRNKVDVHAVGQLGRTALHMAAASGYQNVAAMLLQHGASPDAISGPEDLSQTPLLIACFYGHLGIVRLLLEKGAKMTAANLHGDSALHIATVQNKLEVVKLLLEKSGPGIAELLEARGYRGRTPLHAAAAWGRADVARLLLSKGANVRAKSGLQEECGDSPLHLSAYYGNVDVSKVIIDADPASLELRNENEETPLNRACFNGQISTARLLLNRGASATVRDKSNKTPLYYAKVKSEQIAASNSGENPAATIVQLLMQNRQNLAD